MKMSTQRSNATGAGGGGGTANTAPAEKDLEKFIKFLALKATQVVVQSRLGEKLETKCNPLASGNDWFNLVIVDHPDVYAETKRALALAPGDSILQRLPLCVEISLQTAEGDRMVLEVWSLDVHSASGGAAVANGVGGAGQQQMAKETDKNEQPKNGGDTVNKGNNGSSGGGGTPNSAAIYNRMGVLLKSLISLTRATPAYKLSRRQCADSYGIYYRIYVDRPQVHTLGEGYKQARIGQLQTAAGAVSMAVAYRTKMTITPTAVARGRHGAGNAIGDPTAGGGGGGNNGIMLKSDHFRPHHEGQSPTSQQHAGGAGINGTAAVGAKKVGGGPGGTLNGSGAVKVVDIDKPLRPGAFTDLAKLHQYTEKDFVLPETPPFEWLLRRRTRCESGGSGGGGGGGSIESLNRKSESPPVASSPLGNGHQHNINNNNFSNGGYAMNGHAHNGTGGGSGGSNSNNNNNNNVAAFKSLENDENAATTTATTTTPLLTALVGKSPSASQSSLSQSPIKSLLIPAINAAAGGRHTTAGSGQTPPSPPNDDDNLLKELNIAFASPTSHVNDLAKFYRDCYHAPPLSGLSELRTASDEASCSSGAAITNITTTAGSHAAANAIVSGCSSGESSAASLIAIDDLSRQLEQFETSLEDYDKLVSQLGLTTSTTSTTGSRSSGGLQMSN